MPPSPQPRHSASDSSPEGVDEAEPQRPAASRGGTQVIELLGATIDELINAPEWLPHTTRAALTGLRKRGVALAIDRSDLTKGGDRSTALKGILPPGTARRCTPMLLSPTPSLPRGRSIARRSLKRLGGA